MLHDSPGLIYLSWDDLIERREELEELMHGYANARAAVLGAPSVLLLDVQDLREKVRSFAPSANLGN